MAKNLKSTKQKAAEKSIDVRFAECFMMKMMNVLMVFFFHFFCHAIFLKCIEIHKIPFSVRKIYVMK